MLNENGNKTTKSLKFDRQFWKIWISSYLSFSFLLLTVYLLGFIPTEFLFRGLIAIFTGMGLTALIWLIYRLNPVLRLRVGYVFVGAWIGFLIVFFGGLPFFRAIAFPIVLFMFIAIPATGGLIGYLAGKRKHLNANEGSNYEKNDT